MPYFICPNCGNRELSGERTAGFSTRPKSCTKCGFGFLFELLDDYIPGTREPPSSRCDKDGRLVLDLGKNAFELTGLKDEDAIGRPVHDVLGLEVDPRQGTTARQERRQRTVNGHRRTRSRRRWNGACARSARRSRSTPRVTFPTEAVADVFPAYDDDGGLLLVLTPE